MSVQIAQLETQTLFEEMYHAYGASPFFIERDIAYAQFARRAAAVQKQNQGQGLALRGALDAFLGDVEGLESTATMMAAAPHSDSDLFNLSSAFARLGLYARAAELAGPLLRARSGFLSQRRDRAYMLGLYQQAAAEFAEARSLRIELPENAEMQHGKTAADIFAANGVSDAVVNQILDAAGSVIRSRRRLCNATGLNTAVAEDLSLVALQVGVNEASPSELFEMNMALVEEMSRRDLPMLDCLVVTIERNWEED